MSGLHEAFDEIVARVPVYGDLDGAIEQAEQERRRRFSVVASLSAAAAVLLVVAGVLVIARDDDGAPQPIGPPSTQTPSPTESRHHCGVVGSDPLWHVACPLTEASQGLGRPAGYRRPGHRYP